MAHYPTEWLTVFEHFSKMLDSALSQDIPRIMGRLEELKVKLSLRLTAAQTQPSVAGFMIEKERYLTVREVIARYPVTAKWLYRHKKNLPHSQPSRKVLLFPEVGIAKFFASRKYRD